MGLLSFVNSIGSGFKKLAVKVYETAIKPVTTVAYTKVVKPVYQKVIVPVANTSVNVVKKVVHKVDRITDAGINVAEESGNLIKTISNSPLIILGAIGVGSLILLKK